MVETFTMNDVFLVEFFFWRGEADIFYVGG